MAKNANILVRMALALTGGLPVLALSTVLLAVWVQPMSIDAGGWVRMAASLVIIEFLLLHSGAFMATGSVLFSKAWQRACWFLVFSLIYIAAIWGFTSWSDGSYVAWVLIGVLGSRLITLVVLRDKKGTILAFQRSAVGFFLLVVTAAVCLFPLPELGISEEIRQGAFGEAEDFLTSHPQRFIAWGVVYFFLMGLTELFVGWRLPDWSDEEAEKGWKVLQGK